MTFLHLFDPDLLASTLREATPILLAALGGLLCMRAGVFNIALEGLMLIGAFFGTACTYWTGNVWIGLLGGAGAGVIASLLLGVVIIWLRANQILAGIAMNLLALGLTGFLCKTITGGSGALTPSVGGSLPRLHVPLVSSVPVLGRALSGQTPLVYASALLVLVTAGILYRTRAGLALRAVGEHAGAAGTAGIDASRIRFGVLAWSGLLCGLGGVHLALGYVSGFTLNMTQGRGFTAFAATIFGQLDPLYTCLASLIFGFADAFGIRLQLEGVGVPSPIVQMFPYVLGIVALTVSTAWLLRRNRHVAGLSLLA
jgi:general nucleoside transport system permease protein